MGGVGGGGEECWEFGKSAGAGWGWAGRVGVEYGWGVILSSS